jgi:hypothetical protein
VVWLVQINVSEKPAAVLFRMESENGGSRFPRGRFVALTVSRRLRFLVKSCGVCGGHRVSLNTSVSNANSSIFINHPVIDSM